LCRFAKDRNEVIRVEIIKLLAAGFICECKNPVWIANPVLVPKKIGQWRMCIDYTDLNRHYHKDLFPLPRIDQVVDSTARSVLLCVTEPPKIVPYYRLSLSTWPLNNNKELLSGTALRVP
jgi:hypothetical protein